jgi:hypothetical protein
MPAESRSWTRPMYISVRRLLPTVHSQAIANHSFAGFLPAIRSSFIRIILLQSFAPFPLWSSWVTADHSFAGYCQPFIRRLSTSHFAGFLQVIHESLPTIPSQPCLHRLSPVIHSHQFVLVFCPSFTGHCQTLYHRLLPVKQSVVTLSLYLMRTSL